MAEAEELGVFEGLRDVVERLDHEVVIESNDHERERVGVFVADETDNVPVRTVTTDLVRRAIWKKKLREPVVCDGERRDAVIDRGAVSL